MEEQRIKNHPLYPEYATMRIRQRELFSEQEEIREECAEIEDFKEACRTFVSASKKLDDVEKILRKEVI